MPQENDPLKTAVSVLRSFLTDSFEDDAFELKTLHIKHETEVPVFSSVSFGTILWD